MDHTWYSQDKRLQLKLTVEQAKWATLDDDVYELCKVPDVAKQLAQMSQGDVRRELASLGYTPADMRDAGLNLQRIVWTACIETLERDEEDAR
jgi:hypothetical protein